MLIFNEVPIINGYTMTAPYNILTDIPIAACARLKHSVATYTCNTILAPVTL